MTAKIYRANADSRPETNRPKTVKRGEGTEEGRKNRLRRTRRGQDTCPTTVVGDSGSKKRERASKGETKRAREERERAKASVQNIGAERGQSGTRRTSATGSDLCKATHLCLFRKFVYRIESAHGTARLLRGPSCWG